MGGPICNMDWVSDGESPDDGSSIRCGSDCLRAKFLQFLLRNSETVILAQSGC